MQQTLTNWYGVVFCVFTLWSLVQMATVAVLAEIKSKKEKPIPQP